MCGEFEDGYFWEVTCDFSADTPCGDEGPPPPPVCADGEVQVFAHLDSKGREISFTANAANGSEICSVSYDHLYGSSGADYHPTECCVPEQSGPVRGGWLPLVERGCREVGAAGAFDGRLHVCTASLSALVAVRG